MDLESVRALLDAPAMACLFGDIPALQGRKVEASQLVGMWVKPGRHFNACYQLSLAGGGTMLASGFALGPLRAAQVASTIDPHASAALDPATCAHCSTQLAQPGLLLQLFPFDYRLPALRACLDPGRVGAALGAVLSATDCQPVGYRPGMRCQIRYRITAAAYVYGKVAVERSPGQASHLHHQVHAALVHSPRLFRVPQPLRYVPELQLAVVAEAAGESFYEALRTRRNLSAEIRTVAQALADFHRLEVEGVQRVYVVGDEIELLRPWLGLIAELYPDLTDALNEGQADLARTQPDPVTPRAFVHRDFYDKQVLLSPERLTVLDMDTACRGEPEIDLGNFCAQLRLRGLQWDLQSYCAGLEDIFLTSYPGSVRPGRVAWYRRSSLLRLACGYALRPRWRHLAPTLLAEVTTR